MKTLSLVLVFILLSSLITERMAHSDCNDIIDEYIKMKHDHYYIGRSEYHNAMETVLVEHGIILPKDLKKQIEVEYQRRAAISGYKPYGNK